MTRPLSGTVVVAVEHSVAGPLCTRILADLGATVVKIERPPHGDFARHWDANAGGESAQFWWLNRGKHGVMLDLKSGAGRAELDQLLAAADVVVHSISPRAAERLRIDPSSLHRRYPSLVHCALSGYGGDGPLSARKAYDMLIQAESGIMGLTGTPDEPMRVGVSICDVATGIYASVLVLAALAERESSGQGRALDVAMFDVAVEFMGPMLLSYLNSGVTYPRRPDGHHAIAPYGLFTCADGRKLLLAIQQNAEWERFCTGFLCRADLAVDPRFATNPDRLTHRDEVDAIVAEALAGCPADEAERRLEALGLAYGAMNEVPQVAAHRRLSEAITSVERADGTRVAALTGLAARAFGHDDAGELPPDLHGGFADVLGIVRRAQPGGEPRPAHTDSAASVNASAAADDNRSR